MITAESLGFDGKRDKELVLPKTIQQQNQEELDSDTDRQLSGTAVKTDDIYLACKSDLNMLAGTALPDIFEYLFPPIYLAIWAWLLEYAVKTRDFSKLALGMPRGFAKTTLVKLFILFCILFTHRKFILVISNTEAHGINIITDIMAMLKEPNIIKIFGDYSLNVQRDKLNLQIFSFRGRQIILGAIGAEGSIRGLNLGFDRPDVMIFEDFQTKEDSESDELSKKLMTRMVGTIMKAKSPKGCLYLYIANMYPTSGSILRKLKDNPFWTKFIVGGILADGTSLWEELQPIQQLLEEFQNDFASGNGDVFFAEVLNDETAGIRAGIDINAIPNAPYTKVDKPQGKLLIVDPAGAKDVNDLNAVGYFEVFDGKPVFQDIAQGHWNPLELITQTMIMAINNRCSLIVVEGVVYQTSLLFWFDYICQHHQLDGFFFEGINPHMKSKNSRIKTNLRTLVQTETNGRVVEPTAYIGPKVMAQFKHQILQWNPLLEKNVDELLDLNAYAAQVLQEFGDLTLTEYSIESLVFQNARVLPAYLTSPI
jgi:hypothetical protein